MAGRIARLLRGFSERKAVAFEAGFWAALSGVARSRSGATVTAETALECAVVLACVRAIASGVAMMPFDRYRRRPDGGRDLAAGDRMWDGLRDSPNAWQTWPEWVETTLMHAVLCGDGVSFKNRPDPRGPIRELIPLAPGAWSIEQRQDYELVYRITFADGRHVAVPQSDVFHLRAPSWNNHSGMPAVRLAREAIGLALATEESHARLHGNGVRPSGVLTTEGSVKPEDQARIREQFQQGFGGLENVGKTPVLTGGLKWTQVTMTGVDAQHVETRKHQIEEVCRALGVFPAVIGHSDKAATFASVEQFFLAHVVHSLGPWMTRLEARMGLDLLTPVERREGVYFKFSAQALLRGDAKARGEFYRAGIELGFFTRNDVRAWEDLNPRPGLDEPLRPRNLATQAEVDAEVAAKGAADAATVAAVKSLLVGHNGGPPLDGAASAEAKAGRVLSAANERRIVTARDELNTVLAQVQREPEAALDGSP